MLRGSKKVYWFKLKAGRLSPRYEAGFFIMGIYSTSEIDNIEDYKKIIRDRVENLDQMSKPRIVEILEALVQVRDYDDYYDSEYAYNNFWTT